MNNNIEDGIIGCILVEPNSLIDVYDKIKPEMFNSLFCKKVYETALGLWDKGIKFDATILANELANAESSPDNFLQQFSTMIMATPSSVLINGYADKLIANYQCKRLKTLLKDLEINPNNVKDVMGEIVTEIENIKLNQKRRTHKIVDVISENKNEYFKDNNMEQLKIRFQIDLLDDCVTLKGGEVTILGARPSVGKSAFALQILKNVAKQGFRVGYFNLEMLDQQIYERLICSESKIDLQRLKRATTFLGDEKERFDTSNDELGKLDIRISSGSFSISEIKAESRHQNYDLIVIDYLQLIRADKSFESRRVEVGQISRQIKELAMELDVPIIVLSQLSRKSEYTQDKEPSMADLRETGDIEQDASTIILMWNLSDDFRNFKGLKVDKNRQGKLLSIPLEFDGDYMKFEAIKGKTIDDIKTKINEFKPVSTSEELPFN